MALARRDHLGLIDNDWSGSYRGRQAAREHIVPSALSQQVQRLERSGADELERGLDILLTGLATTVPSPDGVHSSS